MDKKAATRINVVKEILDTELVYVKSLDTVVEKFLNVMLRDKSIPCNVIFSDIKIIAEFHHNLYNDLNEKPKEIGSVFVKLMPYLKIYCGYCKNFDKSRNTINSLRVNNISFKNLLRDIINSLSQPEPLESFLIKPVQRIPRYKLLLNELLKNTEEYHADYKNLVEAYDGIVKIADSVNESMHIAEGYNRMMELKELVCGYSKELIQPGRRFVFEGDLVKISHQKADQRYGILFNDLFLLTTNTQIPRQRFQVHSEIPLINADCRVVGRSGQFLFMVFTPTRTFLFDANNQNSLDNWVGKLFENITACKYTVPGKVTLKELVDPEGILDSTLPFRPPKDARKWKSLLKHIHIDWDKIKTYDELESEIESNPSTPSLTRPSSPSSSSPSSLSSRHSTSPTPSSKTPYRFNTGSVRYPNRNPAFDHTSSTTALPVPASPPNPSSPASGPATSQFYSLTSLVSVEEHCGYDAICLEIIEKLFEDNPLPDFKTRLNGLFNDHHRLLVPTVIFLEDYGGDGNGHGKVKRSVLENLKDKYGGENIYIRQDLGVLSKKTLRTEYIKDYTACQHLHPAGDVLETYLSTQQEA